MFESDFSADEFVRAGIECISLANNKEIAAKMNTSCSVLAHTADNAFGDKVIKLATNAETMRRMFRVSIRVDVLQANGVEHNIPSSFVDGSYMLRIKHSESGVTVYSTAQAKPVWKESFVIGPVQFQDSIEFSLIYRPQKAGIVQWCCPLVLGIISQPVSDVSPEDIGLKSFKFEDLGSARLLARVQLWREPKRAYVSHVIVILALLKQPVRLVNKLSWESIWTTEEIALLKAHAMGLSRAAILTARLHALSVAAKKIPPNFQLVFEALSKLRLISANPHEDRVIDLCRKLNKNIQEYLESRKAPMRSLTAYDQTQVVGMLGCCAFIEDFDLTLSKEHFRQFVIAEINVYFDEWLQRLTPLKGDPKQFLVEMQRLMLEFSYTYGPVNGVVKAAWGDHLNEFLSEPAKKFMALFRDVALNLNADESFDIYLVVISFSRYFNVKFHLEDCFAASTIILWFNKLRHNHREWIGPMVSTDDFVPVAEGVYFSSGFRNFRDLLHDRLCVIYQSILVKPPIITKNFAETLCVCCLFFCKQTQAALVREKFFKKLDVASMSVRFAMAVNGVSECFEMLTNETLYVKEQGQGEGGVQALPIPGVSVIAATKMNLAGKIFEISQSFLTRVGSSVRQQMLQVANSTTAQEIGSRAMHLNEYLNTLLGVLCENINRVIFSAVLESLFQSCVSVLKSVTDNYHPWSPWHQRRDPTALIECARLLRECFSSSGTGAGLPLEKVNTPDFLWLESKLESLTRTLP